jgi:four helix bundle protein
MTPTDLQNRLKNFALRLVPLCAALPKAKLSEIIEGQLLRSGFSAAANYRASCNAQSKKAFNSKLSIALEEIDEACFWIETIKDAKLMTPEKLSAIHEEGVELTKILGASRRTSVRNLKSSINN